MTAPRCMISGHRGARALWPENTLAGFAGALALGVDALELDVVLTADAVPVVAHDLTLNPDLARGPDGLWLDPPGPAVRGLAWAEMARFDVGRARPGSKVARAHPRQQPADGQRVPTLASVLRLAAAYPARLDVELKTDPARPDVSPDPAHLAALVVDAAEAAGVLGRVALRSFDWRSLRVAAAIRPATRLCFLTEQADAGTLARVRQAAAGRDATWAPGFAALTAGIVGAAHTLGLRVEPWTVNDPADMARLVDWEVDGFCTDAPDLARALLPGA